MIELGSFLTWRLAVSHPTPDGSNLEALKINDETDSWLLINFLSVSHCRIYKENDFVAHYQVWLWIPPPPFEQDNDFSNIYIKLKKQN